MSSNTPPTPTATVSPVQSPYAVRQINLTFKLGTGNFGTSGSSTLTFTGLRVICHVEAVVFPQMGSTLTMKVYGMSLDHMNALSVAGLLFDTRQNLVLVQAGDDVLGLSTVFTGQIIEAYPSLDTAEDAHFYVYASVSSTAQLKPVAPSSYPGSVPAATAMQAMATQAGFNFQNNGVTAVLQSPYFPGTAWQQIQSAVRAANCFAFLDGPTNTLTIWPKNAATPPAATVLISPKTGMIGYPKFQKKMIIVRTLFNPQLALRPSLTVMVQSQLAAANNAKLTVVKVDHDLASQMPDGPWETTVEGTPP
jgi:hypothetical protein